MTTVLDRLRRHVRLRVWWLIFASVDFYLAGGARPLWLKAVDIPLGVWMLWPLGGDDYKRVLDLDGNDWGTSQIGKPVFTRVGGEGD